MTLDPVTVGIDEDRKLAEVPGRQGGGQVEPELQQVPSRSVRGRAHDAVARGREITRSGSATGELVAIEKVERKHVAADGAVVRELDRHRSLVERLRSESDLGRACRDRAARIPEGFDEAFACADRVTALDLVHRRAVDHGPPAVPGSRDLRLYDPAAAAVILTM